MRMSVLACVAAAALSCRGDPAPTSKPGPAATPGPTAPAPASAPAPTSIPAAAPVAAVPPPLSRASVIEPAGPSPLSRTEESVVDPASSYEIELPGRVTDARLVLLDAADALVPARSTQEVGASTRLTLAPAAPLVPGSRYVLRVEGESTRELHDGVRAYAPLSFAILAAGTPPPPAPKRKPKAKRRR